MSFIFKILTVIGLKVQYTLLSIRITVYEILTCSFYVNKLSVKNITYYFVRNHCRSKSLNGNGFCAYTWI